MNFVFKLSFREKLNFLLLPFFFSLLKKNFSLVKNEIVSVDNLICQR